MTTKSSSKPGPKPAAPKATASKADEPKTPEAPAPAPETPTDEPKAPADKPADAPEAPADEKPTDETSEASGDGEKADGTDKDQADEDGEKESEGPSTEAPKAPHTAPLDAPEKQTEDDDKEPESTRATDAGADKLANRPKDCVRDTNGNKVDPDSLFTEPDATGAVYARVRLLKHGRLAYDRPITTLLIAQGQSISPAGAELIKARIRAEDA